MGFSCATIMLDDISRRIIVAGDSCGLFIGNEVSAMAETQPMTEAMYYILLSLEQPVHGYGMMQRIRELSHGRVKMGPGTLYGVLTRMRHDGWIEQVEAEGDARRKTYVLTELGRQELRQEYQRLKLLVSDGAFLEEGKV